MEDPYIRLSGWERPSKPKTLPITSQARWMISQARKGSSQTLPASRPSQTLLASSQALLFFLWGYLLLEPLQSPLFTIQVPQWSTDAWGDKCIDEQTNI